MYVPLVCLAGICIPISYYVEHVSVPWAEFMQRCNEYLLHYTLGKPNDNQNSKPPGVQQLMTETTDALGLHAYSECHLGG
jgi:hypothetical protein